MSEKRPVLKLWLCLFLASFALVMIASFNLLDLKANYHLYYYVVTPAIGVASFALYKLLRSRNIKFIWAILIALVMPFSFLVYPELSSRHDLYCAERKPGSFYYDPSKKDSIIPCVYEHHNY